MGNWSDLKASVAEAIKTNGNQEITGQILQNVLNNIVSNLGENATFAGIATPETNPGSPDGPVFYVATEEGTYANFNIKIKSGEMAFLIWTNNLWIKNIIKVGSSIKIFQSTGDSTSGTMSQKAISDELETLDNKVDAQKSEVDAAKNEALDAIDNEKQDAIADFSAQRVTPEMLSDSVKQLIENSGEKTITNFADDEDIVATEENNYSVLKFKDRPYNPSGFSGMGTKILRRNISSSKNVLTQAMVNDANTIYEIRYDFDLNGTTITFGENTVLLFLGGSLSNGTIAGNRTSIIAPKYKIFGDDLEFSDEANSFYTDAVYAEWWGCTGYFPSEQTNTSVFAQDASHNANVIALPDCAPYFNKAFQFAHRYSCEVKALGCAYAVRSTIKILDYTTFNTEESTVFCVYIKGEGKTVVTQSTETAEFSTEEVDDIPAYLKQNQYIDTPAMGVAFEVSSCKVKILGRGTISTNHTQCCIGLLVKSRSFETLDMSYFLQIDLRFIGGVYGETAGDSTYSYGYGAPTDEALNSTGATQYYVDLSSVDSNSDYVGLRFKRYSKGNNSTTWSENGVCWKRLNTDIRFEMSQGGAGGRLIDPQMRIGCMYGFRGVELIAHDGGWFNISVWNGTISNKYGNFISIYTDGAIESHDFSGVSMQWGGGNYETCIFYAIKTKGITIGASADMAYSGPKLEYGFYFGKFTQDCVMTWIDNIAYVCDLGTDNLVAYNLGHDPQAVYGSMWFNIWENRLEKSLGFKKITTLPTEESLKEEMSAAFVIDSQFPNLFDGDKSTYETFIDANNGLYGMVFLYNLHSSWVRMTKDYAYLVIEYCISGNNYTEGNFKYMVNTLGFGSGGDNLTNFVRNIPTTREWIGGYINYTGRIVLPISKADTSNGRIIFFTDSDNIDESLKLDIINIKLLTSYQPQPAELDKIPTNFNVFYPRYSYIEAEDGSIFLNIGDAKNNDWVNINNGLKMSNEVVLSLGFMSKTDTQHDLVIDAYLPNTASYELIDPKGFITAKIKNTSIEGNSNVFPGGYGSGYRTLTLALTGTEGEDYEYPYYFKIRFKNIAGINMLYGYCKMNLPDILRKGLSILASSSMYEQGEIVPIDDISDYVKDIRTLSLSLVRDTNSTEGTERTTVSCGAFNKIEYLRLYSSIKMYGNLANLPDTLYHLEVRSKGMKLTYNTSPRGKIWNRELSYLTIAAATAMTSEMVDALLIDLADSIEVPRENNKLIELTRVAGNRTADSDDAVAKLEELGFTVSITT